MQREEQFTGRHPGTRCIRLVCLSDYLIFTLETHSSHTKQACLKSQFNLLAFKTSLRSIFIVFPMDFYCAQIKYLKVRLGFHFRLTLTLFPSSIRCIARIFTFGLFVALLRMINVT